MIGGVVTKNGNMQKRNNHRYLSAYLFATQNLCVCVCVASVIDVTFQC